MAQTISYNLDSLGWMQFESLIQVLLKSELGIGVEAWGGSADHGRDAYCAGELNFPSRHTTNPGPFVFQAKFIAGANAAGADFESILRNAVVKEASLVQNRIAEGKWKSPKQYILITNAPLTAAHRKLISDIFTPVVGDCVVTAQGAGDVCALLDLNISVARAFPQLLSLRNLFEILDQVVKNEIVQRTDAVLREAEALSSVFVPTKAYEDAWTVLGKHSFVVLEGAPEMGKTAVAWIIAAVMLAQKWQAIDCDQPSDFFKAYSDDSEQIFIADDAFGTTEYDINRGSEWGRQLHKVIPKLDKRHWLIWTSRMHILQKALQEMSLQGSAAKFPDQKEILVKASRIDSNERALMLYRHARAADLAEDAKVIVRKHAKDIVENQSFTPERIRRFVREALPGLQIQIATGEVNETQLTSAIKEALENPTERMRKAYRQLEDAQRAVLIAILDCDRSPTVKALEEAVKRFQEPRRPIQEEIYLLKEGFLQDSVPHKYPWQTVPEIGVDWIHPSYRDLVIEELERDATASEHFLQNCSWIGLKLALSIAGGDKGLRRYPLMTSDKSWTILQRRLIALLQEVKTSYPVYDILQTVRGSLDGTNGLDDVRKKLAQIITSCCSAFRDIINKQPDELDGRILEQYYELTMVIAPPPSMPEMYQLWKKVQGEFEQMLQAAEDGAFIEETILSRWIKVVEIVVKTDKRILVQDGYPDKYDDLIDQLCKLSENEANETLSFSDDDAVSSESDRLSEIGTDFAELITTFPEHEARLRHAARTADARSESLRETSKSSHDTGENAWSGQRNPAAASAIDLERLFSDL